MTESMRTTVVKLVTVSALWLGALAAVPPPATADEAKTPVSAAMLLNLLAQPSETREASFDKSLREDGPAPRPTPVGEVLDDGTVRYGRTTLTVRNPCPPGTAHYEPPSLPGRRARN